MPQAQHSSKIYEFFGFTPGQTPPLSRIFIGNGMAPDTSLQPPDTATSATFSDGRATANGHANTNGHVNGAAKRPTTRQPLPQRPRTRLRSPFRALVQDFGAIWFTIPLNTGALSILLRLLPSKFNFPGRITLALILIILTLFLFILSTLIFILRLLWFRRSAYEEITSSAGDDLDTLALPRSKDDTSNIPRVYGSSGTGFKFISYWPTVWLTIVAFAILDGAEAPPEERNKAFVNFGYVAWWVGAAWSMIVLFAVLGWLLAGQRVVSGRRTPGGRFARPVALVVATSAIATVGFVGGLLAQRYGRGVAVTTEMLGPVVVVSFCVVGVGMLLTGFVIAVAVHELVLIMGWPPSEQTSIMFMFVGPMAMGAAALLFLGDAVEKSVGAISGKNRGPFPSPEVALSLHVSCVLLALFAGGMAVLSLTVAIMGVVYRLNRRELQWNPTWNAVPFTITSLGIATAQFSNVLHSRFFGVVTCVLLIVSAVGFLVHVGWTLVYICQGKLLVVREDRRTASQIGQLDKSQ